MKNNFFNLFFYGVKIIVAFSFVQFFSYTINWRKIILKSQFNFLAQLLVRFVKINSTFGMTNNYKFAAYRCEHIRRNLPGIGALGMFTGILGAQRQPLLSAKAWSSPVPVTNQAVARP